jgi:inositol hexakisphosphate/diphosphoinositol-pentakisphosphate kinase
MTGKHAGASKSSSMQDLPKRPIPKSNSKDMWTPGLVPRSKSTPGDLTGRRIEDGPILVGICAMDQKARSKPMTEMLNRLTSFTAGELIEFKVVYFGNDTLLNEPIEEWPRCEALIAFHSTGFPLQKAQEYVALRRPLVFNDLQKQEMLFDRRETYRILQETDNPWP